LHPRPTPAYNPKRRPKLASRRPKIPHGPRCGSFCLSQSRSHNLDASPLSPRARPFAWMHIPSKVRIIDGTMPEPNSGCWIWYRATRGSKGALAGCINLGRPGARLVYSAHRYSYEAFKGPIPDGLHVLHKCDVSLCCNPDHLFLGTHVDNMADMVAKGRSAKGARHGRAKLNPKRVRLLRKMLGAGASVAAQPRQLGVTRSTVRRVFEGRTWAHVD
jgi:hypothetical protein